MFDRYLDSLLCCPQWGFYHPHGNIHYCWLVIIILGYRNHSKQDLEPAIGELRYIARLNADLLPNEEPFGVVSNIADGTVVEGSDVVSAFDAIFGLEMKLTDLSTWLMAKPEASSTPANGSSMTTDTVRFLDLLR